MEHNQLTPDQMAQRLIEHEARIRRLEAQVDAAEDVFALLFLQLPDNTGLRVLSRQANELEQPGADRHQETIDLLDRLRSALHAVHDPADGEPEQH